MEYRLEKSLILDPIYNTQKLLHKKIIFHYL